MHIPETADTFAAARPYRVVIHDRPVLVDPKDKGEPGDLVVVWLKKREPRLVRRLARYTPYNSYYFRTLETGDLAEVPTNKVVAVRKVLEDTEPAA